jgi:hypothetical protein
LPSEEIVGGIVSDHLIGSTNVSDPILFLEVNGIQVASSYVIQRIGNSVRFIFPKKIGNQIYLMAMGQTYGAALPQLTISVRVFVAE